ncbi:hypothetical protein SOVF_050460 [Spinacia oleracea]|nr:hypothetical protein SOVF_050460 [Spinacia oleracea]
MAEISSLDKKVSLDLARELLIAISESLPENLLNPESLPDKSLSPKSIEEPTNDHEIASMKSADKDEELRSELISISYLPSPDKVSLPANGHL